jgi:hypothetical protein
LQTGDDAALIFEEKINNFQVLKITFRCQLPLKTGGRYDWVEVADDIDSYLNLYKSIQTYKVFKTL